MWTKPTATDEICPEEREEVIAGEYVRLDEDFLDRYVVSPGDDAPDDYRWAR